MLSHRALGPWTRAGVRRTGRTGSGDQRPDLVTGEETIRKVKVSESRAERVFKLKGIERYAGPFGIWSGRTPDGSWMFVRDRSTQEVYQLSVELP